VPINDWFEGRYAIAREAIEARLFRGDDPMIIRTGEALILLHRGRRQTRVVLTEAYHRAKAVCHVPAAVYLLLSDHAGRALTDETLRHARALADELREEALEGEEAALVDCCVELLEEVTEQGNVTLDRLSRFASETQASMGAVIMNGTRAYLERLDETVETWTEGWDEDTWERLLVVICAGHAPRYKESTRTYFTRLLGETHGLGAKGEERILYAEGASSERDAMELAATHLLNRELGRFFMKSSVALQEDVLGDAAEAVLDDVIA